MPQSTSISSRWSALTLPLAVCCLLLASACGDGLPDDGPERESETSDALSSGILDPGFERQMSRTLGAPWNLEGHGHGVDIGLGFQYSGKANAFIRTNTGWNAMTQDFYVDANKAYTISVMIRTSANVHDGYFGVRDLDNHVLNETKFGPLAGYTVLRVPFVAGNRSQVRIFAGYWAPNADSWLQLDDFNVTSEMRNTRYDWFSNVGYFHVNIGETPDRAWVEMLNGGIAFYFRNVTVNDQYAELYDPSRGMSVRLYDAAEYAKGPYDAAFQLVRGGHWDDRRGWSYQDQNGSFGYFLLKPGYVWLEWYVPAGGSPVQYTYRETARNLNYIELYDVTRNTTVRLFDAGMQLGNSTRPLSFYRAGDWAY